MQPATVRTRGRDYELVAGERRLRAAKMAGLRELPCLIAQVGEEDSALLALMENLQRRDLSFMEEAAAIAQLVQRWGLSQEEAARRLGKSQSAVANKLRLLRLPETVVEQIRQGDLSERHARALLRLTPGTGRTHQLRVHCAYMGFPILGDPQYGTEESRRFSSELGLTYQMLCAHRLEFTHPLTGDSMVLESRMDVGV